MLILTILLFLLPCLANSEEITSNVLTSNSGVTESKLKQVKTSGVTFSLKQIIPIAVESFYLNRGFTKKQIEAYSSSCVFAAVLRNDNAPGTIHFISNNWQVLVNGKAHTLLSTDKWVQKLTTKDSKKSALVAFRWAQFPHEQEYEPGGDWNQGMLSVGLPAGTQFDITAHWDIDGKRYKARLSGVECAK